MKTLEETGNPRKLYFIEIDGKLLELQVQTPLNSWGYKNYYPKRVNISPFSYKSS